MADDLDVFEALAGLAKTDPKSARRRFVNLEDGERDAVLERCEARDAARLRQIIATAQPVTAAVKVYLRRWARSETDEFTKRAIDRALSEGRNGKRQRPAKLARKDLLRTYRYVHDRLAHRINNALPALRSAIRETRTRIEALDEPDSDLATLLGRLTSAADDIHRLVVESHDRDYFTRKTRRLGEVLHGSRERFVAHYAPSDIEIHTSLGDAASCSISTSDFLADTMLWNVWNNARQAVDGRCVVDITATADKKWIRLLMSDNGDGFPPEMENEALLMPVTTKAGHEGRGLLEVADAIERAGGDARIIEDARGCRRLQLRIPNA